MVRITLSLEKSIEQNASEYFEKAKKARTKSLRTKEALLKSEKKLEGLSKKKPVMQEVILKKPIKKEWYEKFRWFISSEDFLVIGGRDATTNEIVIKKHTDKEDIVFHTDMAGSPFFVIKTKGRKPAKATIQETANATACYSRAWKMGMATTNVFHVKPEQVTKSAQAGEFLARGSFMIRGKTTYIVPEMKCAVGIRDNQIIGGPVDAVKKNSDNHVIVVQGEKKPSDAAKLIKKVLGSGELDEIIRFLPPGNCKVEKGR